MIHDIPPELAPDVKSPEDLTFRIVMRPAPMIKMAK
jgi:hypothetical protein